MYFQNLFEDEFYQSSDVVHNFLLNQTALTWEWNYPIRSALWLTPVLILTKILNFLGVYHLINTTILIRIYVGCISAYSEVKIVELSAILFSSLEVAEATYQLLIFSWFGFYAASRALITSVEAALFAISFCTLLVRYPKILTQQFTSKIDTGSPFSTILSLKIANFA